MIYFLSNHTDTESVERITGEQVRIIAHPYIEPTWSIEEMRDKCKRTLRAAAEAEKLIINGDYTLVAMVFLERYLLGKKTGFICFEKRGNSQNTKHADGSITHSNVLVPVNVRWLGGD